MKFAPADVAVAVDSGAVGKDVVFYSCQNLGRSRRQGGKWVCVCFFSRAVNDDSPVLIFC